MAEIRPEDLTPETPGTTGTETPVTLQAGDICIAATYRTGEVDIRRNFGDCRVLVYNRDLTLKGALWTGETGLVLGLAYCPATKILIVSDATSKTITRFSADGKLLPPCPDMQGKPFGPIATTSEGGMIIGEHIYGNAMPFIGGGEIYCFNAEGTLLTHHAAERDPGKFGFHGVTNMALTDSDQTAIYISETGRRVMRYDLANGRQLPDLFSFDEDSELVTAGISLLPDGNILIAHVYGASLFSPSGEVVKEYDIPDERGWAAIKASSDGSAFFVANFFTGRLEKRDLNSGDVICAAETDMIYTLAAIAEIS